MLLEELLTQARIRELHHELTRAEREAAALRTLSGPRKAAGPSRAERLLQERYLAGRRTADKATSQRLVWNEVDL